MRRPMPWPAKSRTTLALGELLDGGADVAQADTVPHRRHAQVAAAPRDVDHVPRLGRGLADQEGLRGVAVETVELGGDVDVHQVARRERLLLAGDAVAHDLVAAGAHRGREPVVAELGRPPTAGLRVLAHPAIDLGGGDAGPQPLADGGQGRGGRAPGGAHQLGVSK
jgi:hypothetical protein